MKQDFFNKCPKDIQPGDVIIMIENLKTNSLSINSGVCIASGFNNFTFKEFKSSTILIGGLSLNLDLILSKTVWLHKAKRKECVIIPAE